MSQRPVIRKALGMEYLANYSGGSQRTDGYEGRVPRSYAGIMQARSDLLMQLVCSECGHRSAACDCPASIRRSRLIPYREYLKRAST